MDIGVHAGATADVEGVNIYFAAELQKGQEHLQLTEFQITDIGIFTLLVRLLRYKYISVVVKSLSCIYSRHYYCTL